MHNQHHITFIMRKYFFQDKNYILSGAQYDGQENLLKYTISTAKSFYLQHYNPLGIEDDTIVKIKNYKEFPIEVFESFYNDLAGIYRFQYGTNQLEFLFDGMDHYSKYVNEWNSKYVVWINEFFKTPHFLKAVLHLTVFNAQNHGKTLAQKRLQSFLCSYFDLKIYKYKGIIRNKIAA